MQPIKYIYTNVLSAAIVRPFAARPNVRDACMIFHFYSVFFFFFVFSALQSQYDYAWSSATWDAFECDSHPLRAQLIGKESPVNALAQSKYASSFFRRRPTTLTTHHVESGKKNNMSSNIILNHLDEPLFVVVRIQNNLIRLEMSFVWNMKLHDCLFALAHALDEQE